jgi:hypothetical protein
MTDERAEMVIGDMIGWVQTEHLYARNPFDVGNRVRVSQTHEIQIFRGAAGVVIHTDRDGPMTVGVTFDEPVPYPQGSTRGLCGAASDFVHATSNVAMTLEALCTVTQHEQEAQVSDLKRQVISLKRELLAARRDNTSSYGTHFHSTDPRFRLLTWREFGEERNEKVDELLDMIRVADYRVTRAHELLEQAWIGNNLEYVRDVRHMLDSTGSMLRFESSIRSDESAEDASDDEEVIQTE